MLRIHFDAKYRIVRFLKTLGDASYSIYLIQVITLPLGTAIVRRATIADLIPFELLVLFHMACTVFAGWLCWLIVERPIGRFIASKPSQQGNPEPSRV